ncbi:hypothetical protein D3P07_18650 [Paenibacillus sp. 1011MAR3C5]|uniref:hypothetical protein n=1 Tax=Paenibacillus sp. 1011MAR3C5 TaxID=1675787 RepID=UPI000E6D32F7|nr:hypothetical protein [Paenibacillus sp. 1011MAR3C5]RJE86105.1 hypothetical protein D3P07_18650 [Paenibacillus sp. 1011MAR3C5]
MTGEGHQALQKVARLLIAAAFAITMTGCQKEAPSYTTEEGSSEPSALSTPLTFQIDTATQGPSPLATATPEPLLTGEEQLTLVDDEQSGSEPEQPHWLRDITFENEYATILHQLEYETLMILAKAAEIRFANKEEAPSFEALKSELLKYNAEQRLDPWQTIYENDPGWLLEPSELLFAVNMYEPSLELSRDDDEKVRLNFKTFGQSFQSHTVSRHVEIELLRSGENWRIGDIKSRAAEYAFTKEDAEHIMMTSVGHASYVGDDDTHYFFQDGEGFEYVFHKQNGYFTHP